MACFLRTRPVGTRRPWPPPTGTRRRASSAASSPTPSSPTSAPPRATSSRSRAESRPPPAIRTRSALGTGELVYTGAVRTPAMALAASRALPGPLRRPRWPSPSPPRPTSIASSARCRTPSTSRRRRTGRARDRTRPAARLARLARPRRGRRTGRSAWRDLAAFLAEAQLRRLHDAAALALSAGRHAGRCARGRLRRGPVHRRAVGGAPRAGPFSTSPASARERGAIRPGSPSCAPAVAVRCSGTRAGRRPGMGSAPPLLPACGFQGSPSWDCFT